MTYAANIIAQLEQTTSLAEVQSLGDAATGALNAQLGALTASAGTLAPMVALATAGVSDLASVVTFIHTLQTAVLGPAVSAASAIGTQSTAATADLAAVEAAIAAAVARLTPA